MAATAIRSPALARLHRLEGLLVFLIAAHSVAIGLVLLFATEWGLRFGGFRDVTPLFFPRQAGAFHLVVATGYAMEYVRHRGVTLLLTTKTVAVVFLVGAWATTSVPWLVPLSALGDAVMGLAVLLARLGRPRAIA